MNPIEKMELYPSTRIQSATTTYSEWVPITFLCDLLAFIKLTAQGAYTDETLNINPQMKTPNGDAVDLIGISFLEIGNKVGSLPFLDYLPFTNFGSEIRFKIVTAGAAVDYTLQLDGIAKRRA